MQKDSSQVTGAGAPARPVAAGVWGADHTLSMVIDHIRSSVQFEEATTADRAKHGWAVPCVPVPGFDVSPIHIDVTLLGSPADAHLSYIANDALLASAEAAGAADALSRRRWRSGEARLLGEALATADRHRDEFLAVLARELRSPLAAISNAVNTTHSCSARADDDLQGDMPRILIIEQNVAAADELASLIETAGHGVTRVTYSGHAALAVAMTFAPTVVLMNLELPDISSYDLARQLSQHPRLQNLRLIALTGISEHPGRNRAREAGFERYLIQPCGVAELDDIFA